MNPTRVMFFCLGNICRSPLAEGLFIHHLESRGLSDQFHVESSGTSAFHIGDAPDPGSQRVMREMLGVDISHQRAQQLTHSHVETFDFLIAMDRSNQSNALRWASPGGVVLLRDFEPDPSQQGLDVPDPWGGGGSQFQNVYEIVYRCTERFLDHVLEQR